MRRCGSVPFGFALVAVLTAVAPPWAMAAASGRAAPRGTFHFVLRSGGTGNKDGAAIMFEGLITPGTHTINGVFEMTQPVRIRSGFAGTYAQASATAALSASLTGFPPPLALCMGHGPVVSKNADITLHIDPGWRTGTADISYPADAARESKDGSVWKTISGVALAGRAPMRWRDASSISWIAGSPTVWNGDCFKPDTSERLRLRHLGTDRSRRDLTLVHQADGAAMTSWAIRNDGSRHILARISCKSPASEKLQPEGTTTLVRPSETRGLWGFFDKDHRTCEIEQSHYD